MKLKLYKDTIHGLHAESGSKTTAWGLIRAYCHENDLEVPTMDKIIIVKEKPKRTPKIFLSKPVYSETKDVGGRPTKYKSEYAEQAYKLCLLGATDEELAEFFEVDERTINNWKENQPGFFQSVTRGKTIADAEVAESFHKRATGFEVDSEEIAFYQGMPVRARSKTYYPPDAGAALNWLKNRQPKKWRDKIDVDQNNTNINFNVEVTDEEARRIKAALEDEI